MLIDQSGLSRFERFLSLFTRVRPGEGPGVLMFAAHAFLMLFSYQVMKALREALVLAKYSAEMRSYGVAITALVLMLVVPLYGVVRRRFDGARLLRGVTVFFAVNLWIFAAAVWAGVSVAFVFFVWASIYGIMVVSQLWAFAADCMNVKSGQRLFPVIMVGANLGALAGAKTAQLAVAALTPVGLIIASSLLLLATLWLIGPERAAIPEGSRAIAPEHGASTPRLLGGIGLVLRDRYLLLVALLVVLLNWINTTGEFILADFVQHDAAARATASGGALDPSVLIAEFYGSYQFWVTVVGLAIQLFLVARIYRAVGVKGALVIHPSVVAIGYGLLTFSTMLVGFIPVFTLIRLVKITENATDYSLMNTTRQALFLPVDRDAKYEGKTAIDTFYWRIGDVIQAGVLYVGLNLLGWHAPAFAAVNLVLALAWIGLAVAIGREFGRKAQECVTNVAPEARQPIADLLYVPGSPVEHFVLEDAFVDADPGDVLRLTARLADGKALPGWLRFDAPRRRFHGTAPDGHVEEFMVVVVACDVDGLEATSSFVVRRAMLRD
ncbi:MAG TPA: Npt1/Npt2 family nucleotide transporter [Steroidobacteraceae bacterium]|nr:Npt1/Npt2 family nucleotide transporter [Steroidobacteraceae bacterium]